MSAIQLMQVLLTVLEFIEFLVSPMGLIFLIFVSGMNAYYFLLQTAHYNPWIGTLMPTIFMAVLAIELNENS
ncbi:hypothetical protein C7B76_05605 [filamentous cyanobacterium CCP2]|nr:hypothetical protein C7B76_05605 [filamentous cyanobacterium CCP2]